MSTELSQCFRFQEQTYSPLRNLTYLGNSMDVIQPQRGLWWSTSLLAMEDPPSTSPRRLSYHSCRGMTLIISMLIGDYSTPFRCLTYHCIAQWINRPFSLGSHKQSGWSPKICYDSKSCSLTCGTQLILVSSCHIVSVLYFALAGKSIVPLLLLAAL